MNKFKTNDRVIVKEVIEDNPWKNYPTLGWTGVIKESFKDSKDYIIDWDHYDEVENKAGYYIKEHMIEQLIQEWDR